MKKSFLVLILMNFTLLSFSQENTGKSYRNSFTFSPLKFTESAFQIGYERYIGKENSVYIAAGAIYRDEYDHEEGFFGEVHFRYQVYSKLRESSEFGIYFSPYLQYKNIDVTRELYYYQEDMNNLSSDVTNINSYGAGMLVGMRFTIVKRLLFDLYVGGGMRRTNDYEKDSGYHNYGSSIWDHGYNGIAPKLGFNVGFKF